MPARGYRKDASGNFVRGPDSEAAELEDAAASVAAAYLNNPGGAGSGLGIDAFELPRSTVTRISKASLPATAKLQKEVPIAISKASTIFINYLCSIGLEHAQKKGVQTITADHILAAVDELDWGEADTAALKKDLNRQLRAYRYNARMKREAKAAGKQWVPPTASGSTATKPKGKSRASEADKNAGQVVYDIQLKDGASLPARDGEGEDDGIDEDGIPLSFQGETERNDNLDDGVAQSEFEDEGEVEDDVPDDIENEEDEEEEAEEPVNRIAFKYEIGDGTFPPRSDDSDMED